MGLVYFPFFIIAGLSVLIGSAFLYIDARLVSNARQEYQRIVARLR